MSRPISLISAIVFFSIQILFPRWVFSQPPIVLHDLTLIRGKTISEFDIAAITLSDGSTLQWDQVLKAELTGGDELSQRQAQFDAILKQIGIPMFRLKTRIQQGDWAGAGEIAEPVFDSAMAGTFIFPNPEIEYLVCLATMKSRVGQGSWVRNRPGAVLPFLRASAIEANVDQNALEIAGTSRFAEQREDGLSPELLPVWFDVDQVRVSAKRIAQLAEKTGPSESGQSALQNRQSRLTTTNQVATAIYLASMQIELGQNDLANANLNRLNGKQNKLATAWSFVLQARMLQRAGDHVKAQAMLDKNYEEIVGDARPVAIFYRGLSEFEIQAGALLENHNAKLTRPLNPVAENALLKSSLMLLRLPAIYGESHPELAAAGLHQVAQIAKLRGQVDQSKKLTLELLQRYPRTYHGSLEPTRIDAK